MARPATPRLPIQLCADPPLLRATLERAVTRAGLTVASEEETAIATVRIDGTGTPNEMVDIVIDARRASVSVGSSPPSFALWSALHRLLADLLGTEAPHYVDNSLST